LEQLVSLQPEFENAGKRGGLFGKYSVSLKRSLGILHDFLASGMSFFAAFVIVLGLHGAWITSGILEKTLLFSVGSSAFFYFFSLNTGSWRYASLPDLTSIIKASSVAVFTYVLVQFLYSRGEGLPRAVPVVLWLLLVAWLAGPRLLFRLMKEGGGVGIVTGILRPKSGASQILIYGMNDIAEAYIRSVRLRSENDVFVAGILDDREHNRGRTLQGKKVLGGLKDLGLIKQLLQAKGITVSELVLADNLLSTHDLTVLVDRAVEAGLRISRLPDILHTANIRGNAQFEPKPLEVSELLGRSEVSIANFEVTRLIEGKTILLTGAGGSIGSELSRQISEFNPKKFIICDLSEHFLYSIDLELREKHPELEFVPRIADVRNRERMRSLFGEFQPDIVFHAAALKQVPLMEENVLEAVKTNVLGTKNCADAALEFNAAVFVMISTDKAVNPTNVMGATKRAAEAYCQALDLKSETTRFKTVRFGNVLGSNGSVVPRFAAQISKGGPVTVTHPNIVRYFMSIPEAVTLVLKASAHGMQILSERGKILVLDMGEPVLITELAERMIQLAGLRPGIDIQIKFTGLRPGEKLFEELFDPSEIQENSESDGYRVASPRLVDQQILDKTLRELCDNSEREHSRHILTLLKKIVPEFKYGENHPLSYSADIVPLMLLEKYDG
jgi:FlaA1/EpsC-like NDP-sugar epimerase